MGEALRLGYRALRRHELEVRKDQVPNTFEVGQSSRSVPEQQGAERTPPSLEWSFGSLPLSPSSLVVPSPVALPMTTLAATIMGYDRDLRELYTRSGAVRDEIFSQRYRFRSLEREQERATVTFSAIWRPRENHGLRMRITEERRKRLELADRVARMERRQESREE
ncbi:hypothetical protein Tco_0054413 [Tanacetum coccineum]